MRRVLRIGCDPDLAPRPRVRTDAYLAHDAAEAGDAEALRRLFAPRGAGQEGTAALSGASGGKSPQEESGPAAAPESAELAAAVAAAADVDERDDDDCTPLHLSLLNSNLECARICIMQGSQLIMRCEGAPAIHTALSTAVRGEREPDAARAVGMLLGVGADIRGRDDFGRTPLHVCAELGLEKCAAALLSAAAAQPDGEPLCDELDARGRTPLHLAVLRSHQGMVRLLLVEGASAAARDAVGETPLHTAARRGVLAVLGLLLGGHEAAPTPDTLERACEPDVRGFTPMAWAVWRGHALCARTLLDALPPRAKDAAATMMATHPRADRIRAAVDDPQTGDPASSALAAAVGSGGSGSQGPTLLVNHPVFWEHRTAPEPLSRQQEPPPPENVRRLTVLCDPRAGILRSDEFSHLEWEERPPAAAMADVLRVHEYMYVRRLQEFCDGIRDDPSAVALLDNDTALAHKSCLSALTAAGAAIEAVRRVCEGRNRNAFVALRPPGHHAGPAGIVTNDRGDGSHGFCLLNNVAIAAAYARYNYAAAGIRRIAILDFDVHHGNGTEAIVRQLVPTWEHTSVHSHFCFGHLRRLEYRPWLGEGDAEDVLFVSSHGYGPHSDDGLMSRAAFFYPGTGETSGTIEEAVARLKMRLDEEEERGDDVEYPPLLAQPHQEGGGTGGPTARAGESGKLSSGRPSGVHGAGSGADAESGRAKGDAANADDADDGDDDDDEFGPGQSESEDSRSSGDSQVPSRPTSSFDASGVAAEASREENIVNAGFTYGDDARTWRAVWREVLIPRLRAHNPDIILVSAGFDAHRKDELNMGFIGLDEGDYEWVTQQIMAVANECCEGRVVSVLEGGYRVQGATVSPLAQSVAAHVRVMADAAAAPERWDPEDADWERRLEAREACLRRQDEERKEEAEVDDLKARYAAAGIDLGEELGGRFAEGGAGEDDDDDGDSDSDGDGDHGIGGGAGAGEALGKDDGRPRDAGEGNGEPAAEPGRRKRRRAAGPPAVAQVREDDGDGDDDEDDDDDAEDEDFKVEGNGAGEEDDEDDEDDEGRGPADASVEQRADAGEDVAAPKPPSGADAAPPSKRSRRGRGKVDYVALQRQLEEEKRGAVRT